MQDNLNENQLKNWIKEVGDTPMIPTPEHVANLKEMLLKQSENTSSSPPLPSAASDDSQRTGKRKYWLLSASALALLVFASFYIFVPEKSAWAQMQEAMQKQKWVHITQLEDASNQMWFSPDQQIMSMSFLASPERLSPEMQDQPQMALFIDMLNNVRYEIHVGQKKITKYNSLDRDDVAFQQLNKAFGFLVDCQDSNGIPGLGFEAAGASEMENIEIDGVKITRITSILGEDTPVAGAIVITDIDTVTHLPLQAKIVAEAQGLTKTLLYEYPEEGPQDIYALGIPKTIPVDNLVPAPELEQLLKQREKVLVDFDHYSGFIIKISDHGANSNWWAPQQVLRVWKAGPKWRMEQLNLDPETHRRLRNSDVPPDTDPQEWWKKQAESQAFRVMRVSNGQEEFLPQYDSKDLSVITGLKPLGPVDLNNPFPSTHIFPEQLAYNTSSMRSRKMKTAIEPISSNGPEGSLLIRSSLDEKERNERRFFLQQYWISQEQHGMTLKQESHVSDYIEVSTTKEFKSSPKGYTYPSVIEDVTLRTGNETEGVSRTMYLLDFQESFDDRLFQVPKTSGF